MSRDRDDQFDEEPLPPEDEGRPARRRRPDDGEPKKNNTTVILISVGAALVVLCGCCGVGGWIGWQRMQDAAARVTRSNQLREIGLAYHQFLKDHPRAPENAQELQKYLGDSPKTYAMLTDGSLVFIYGVRPADMPEGSNRTVLAYEKTVPESGGLVLYANSDVEQVTAAEFANKPKAQKR
jgi:hypothetical protein